MNEFIKEVMYKDRVKDKDKAIVMFASGYPLCPISKI